jgi:hypothetical protein
MDDIADYDDNVGFDSWKMSSFYKFSARQGFLI